MLTTYLLQTKQLLQNPPANANPLYSDSDLTSYINRARGQIAGDAECIRNYATLPIVAAQRQYPFADVVLGSPSAGIAGIFNIRYAWYLVGDGQKSMRPRPWAWFAQYKLNNPVPTPGAPQVWSQYGQGETGSIFIDPIPDNSYTLPIDTVCVPIDLVDDSTVEAIPYPWTDAVCFLAAYYALLSAQSAARQADADRMMTRYQEFKNRARKYSNPSIMPYLYEQAPSPVRSSQLGIAPQQGANGG